MRSFVALFLVFACAAAPCRLAASEPTSPTPASDSSELRGYIHISARLLGDLFCREINLNQQVSETILNMTTRGNTQVTCRIGLELVPNPHVAQLRLTANGQATMKDTVGTMRSIRIFSSSQTEIRGSKEVYFYPQGLSLLPARSDCRTAIQVNGIAANFGLVERLAWRRVDRMQSQAEGEVSRRVARRAEQQIESEAGKPLAQLHGEYVDNVYVPLVRQQAFPDMRLSTTPEHLSVTFVGSAAAGANQNSDPPTPSFDVAVCVRDTFVNEFFAPLLAGKTITDRQFANLMQTLIGQTPRVLWVHERTEPWSVTTAKERPLSLRFDENRLSIKLRIDATERGEQHLGRPLQIAAAYSLEITRDGPKLTRLGELSVEFNDSIPSTDEQIEQQLRQFLLRKFGGVFPAELYFDGLAPPEGGSWSKFRRLTLARFNSGGGWLSLGYELPSAPPALTASALLPEKMKSK